MNALTEQQRADAYLAAVLCAVEPALGVRLRARSGPARARWSAHFEQLWPPHAPHARVSPSTTEDRLFGSIDPAATLAAGSTVHAPGILARADGGYVVLTTAERWSAERAAGVVQAIRSSGRMGLVALDEGIELDEQVAPALAEHLAMHVALEDGGASEAPIDNATPAAWEAVAAARRRLAHVAIEDRHVEAIAATTIALGIGSLGAALAAVRVARCAAALEEVPEVDDEHIALAVRLVLVPRARQIPVVEPEPPPPASEQDGAGDRNEGAESLPPEPLVPQEAAAALPPELLEQIAQSVRQRRGVSGRAGVASMKDNRRGRPTRSRAGDPHGGARLDVIATLTAAAPWQRVRGAAADRLAVRRSDFRIKRFRRPRRSTVIFLVDASGSSALHRMAEAKGAVSRVLGECYVRRDQVALIAFRGTGADMLLAPTRALARAKRDLAALPGGGGTPLAAGLEAALALALDQRRRGFESRVVVLTDGRANVRRDGTAGRVEAQAEASAAAARLSTHEVPVILIDTSVRPESLAERLARDMRAIYLPLPHADAGAISAAVVPGRREWRTGSR